MYIYQKGEALRKLGKPADTLNLFASAIEKYGDKVADDGIDKMILAYSDFYDKGKKQMDATIAFLEKAISDSAFREMLVKVPAPKNHPEAPAELTVLGNPIKMEETPCQYYKAAPDLGEDNEEIFKELGFTEEQLAQYRAAGVIN